MNDFNLQKFLIENKMTRNSQLLSENEGNPNRVLELIGMYVDNYFDEGMTAELTLEKIDEILQGKFDDYEKAFLRGEEDNY